MATSSLPVFWAISWKDSSLSKFRGEKSAMTRPDEDSTLSLQASQTDRSEVFSSSEGPARVPSVIRTEASLALLTNSRVDISVLAMQPEVARVGHGGLASQDVGGGPEDRVVHRMSGDLEGKGGVIVAAAISRVQLLGPLAILPWFAGEKGGQSLRGLLSAAEISALVAHARY